MAEITAAVGWVVSPVIRLIIDKTHNYISNKFFKRAGLEDDMAKMETTLLEILATMSIVEKQRIEDQNQVKLVWKIKDAVYDAEYVFNEFEYNVLEKKYEKYEKQQNMVSRIASFPGVFYRDRVGKLMFKNMVKAANEKLNQAQGSAEKLLRLMNVNNTTESAGHDEPDEWHLTSSIINERIVGRETECAKLIDLLFERVEEPHKIIQIIGQGGIGKTTLAQMVFNDPSLNNHFDLKLWLTVSDKFDKLRLTKEMLKYICENFSTVDISFDMLQKKLETELASKKILLVLDDAWYDKDSNGSYIHENEWSKFLAPMNNAQTGSKIVITTRQGLVRSNLNGIRSIMLDGLNNNDSWSLFELCAFHGENQSKRQLLEPIGKMIVSKLMGSALAIRVVGTQLREISDEEVWIRYLNENLADMSDIMKILRRSYERLPQHLKRCFAYCSLFPKDYRLKPDRLVHMWIAQGFIHSEDRNKLEDVGKSYFKALIARSFFQVIKKGNKEYYVMHDLMSDLACHVSKGECHVLDENDSMRNLGSIRHLSVTYEAIDILKNMQGLDKLHTLMLTRGPDPLNEDISNLFILLKSIRVLHIECEMQNLEISQCKHLRYLSVRHPSDMMTIKSSLSKLYLLSALFIKKVYLTSLNEVMLPKFLYSKSCLISVKTWAMSMHLVPLRNKEMRWQLDLLGNVTDIKRSLSIYGLENVTCEEEVIKAELTKKEHLTRLHLYWKYINYVSEEESSKHQAILEALKPASNLGDLKIYGYLGDAWPSWMFSNLFSKVTEIVLNRCERTEMLPSLGQLPLLRHLEISKLTGVRRIGIEFYGNGEFPSLEVLKIKDMRSLKEWSYPCDSTVFPKLKELKIKDCPLLLYLPEMEHFCSLKFFAIINCQELKSFPRGLPNSLRMVWLGGDVHHDLKEQIQSKKGRDWDKIAAISRCDLYSSIDQSCEEVEQIFKSILYQKEYGHCDERLLERLQKYKVNDENVVETFFDSYYEDLYFATVNMPQ